MQRVISIPIQSTSTINIHVPIQRQTSQSSLPSGNTSPVTSKDIEAAGAHVTRMSITSTGSGSVINVSPPTSSPINLALSRSSSRSTPPTTPSKSLPSPGFPPVVGAGRHVNGFTLRGNEAFETDSAVGSSQDDTRSLQSSSSNGDVTAADVNNQLRHDVDNNNYGHCVVALYFEREVAVLIKVSLYHNNN